MCIFWFIVYNVRQEVESFVTRYVNNFNICSVRTCCLFGFLCSSLDWIFWPHNHEHWESFWPTVRVLTRFLSRRRSMLLLFLDCHSQCVCARYWEFPVVLVSSSQQLIWVRVDGGCGAWSRFVSGVLLWDVTEYLISKNQIASLL